MYVRVNNTAVELITLKDQHVTGGQEVTLAVNGCGSGPDPCQSEVCPSPLQGTVVLTAEAGEGALGWPLRTCRWGEGRWPRACFGRSPSWSH